MAGVTFHSAPLILVCFRRMDAVRFSRHSRASVLGPAQGRVGRPPQGNILRRTVSEPRRPDHHLAVDGIDDSRRQATGPSIVGHGRRQVPGERDGQGRAAGDLDDVLERPAVAVLHVARARRQAEFSAV